MSDMWRKFRTALIGLAALGGLIVGIGGVYEAADKLGIQLPKVAWASDVQKLQQYIQILDQEGINRELQQNDLRIFQLDEQIRKYRNRQDPIPEDLVRQKIQLERRNQTLEERKKALQ